MTFEIPSRFQQEQPDSGPGLSGTERIPSEITPQMKIANVMAVQRISGEGAHGADQGNLSHPLSAARVQPHVLSSYRGTRRKM